MEYKSAMPYPPIKVDGKNKNYARSMLSNIGGRNSEMTAVGSYFYNRLVSRDSHKDISDIFHNISIVEMHHLDIFGQLAMELGADPRFWQQRYRQDIYWSPQYISYQKNIHSLLQFSLESEKQAIDKYNYQAEIIKDENIKMILNRIIIDEQIHISIFKNLLDTY